MKKYEQLMGKVSSWLVPGRKFVVHIFAHRDTPYILSRGG
jgi:hypothetical protein